MRKTIPLLPFWLSLVLFVIALALPNNSSFAARKNPVQKRSAFVKKASWKKKGAKKSRSVTRCDAATGKRQALEYINNSGQLCKLAGKKSAAEQTPTEDYTTQTGSAAEVSYPKIPPAYNAGELEEELPEQGEDIAELEKEDDVIVDMDAFKMLLLSFVDGDSLTGEKIACGIDQGKMLQQIMDWTGTRYHFGGTSRSGIDCSAFTRAVFAATGNFELPRTAASQYTVGKNIRNRADLKFGDLVFFHTRRHAYVSHVGIYLADNVFAHASSRYGVTLSSLESTYYSKRMIGARRLERRDAVQLANNPGGIPQR